MVTLEIGGEVDLNEADALRDALADGVGRGSGVRLDLSGVQTFDIAALQLLCAARISALRAGKALHIAAFAPAVSEAMNGAGLPREALGDGV